MVKFGKKDFPRIFSELICLLGVPFEKRQVQNILHRLNKNFSISDFQTDENLLERYQIPLKSYQGILNAEKKKIDTIDQKKGLNYFYVYINWSLLMYPENDEIVNYCEKRGFKRLFDFPNSGYNEVERFINGIIKIEKITDRYSFGLNDATSKLILNSINQKGFIHKIWNESSDLFLNIFKHTECIDWQKLSESEEFGWTMEIINEGKSLWDWSAISINKSINWTLKDIEIFKDYLDWYLIGKYWSNWTLESVNQYKGYLLHVAESSSLSFHSLSENLNLEWKWSLIKEFEVYWDWEKLIKNSSIQWDVNLISRFERYINIESLSSNSRIIWSTSLVLKYKNKWKIEDLIKNSGILWTSELIHNFFDRDNFFTLAKYGRLSGEAIVSYQFAWEKCYEEEHHAHRNSDGYWTHYVSHSYWELLSKNRLIVWDDVVIKNCIQKIYFKFLEDAKFSLTVDTINQFWEYEKSENSPSNPDYDGNTRDYYKDYYFRDLLKNVKITNLTCEDFKENEIRWWGTLNDFEYLNSSVLNLLIQNLQQKSI